MPFNGYGSLYLIFIDHYIWSLYILYIDTVYGDLRNIRIDSAKDFQHGEGDETVMKSDLAIVAVWEPAKSRWIFEL